MASAGFYSGLGQGLQGMAQSLSQFVAQREQRKQRESEEQRFQQTFDESVRSHNDEEAYRKRQETRQKGLDDQALVEKVLSNIATPTRVDADFAGKARTQGMGAFVKDAPDASLINPITHTPMGQIPGGAVANPMISAKDQAMIDNRDAMLALQQEKLAMQGNYNDQIAQSRLGMLSVAQDRLTLQQELAALKAQMDGAEQFGKFDAQAKKLATEQAVKSMGAFDALDPNNQTKLAELIEQYYQANKSAFLESVKRGRNLPDMNAPQLHAPGFGGGGVPQKLDSFSSSSKMPMDPSLMGGGPPAHRSFDSILNFDLHRPGDPRGPLTLRSFGSINRK